MDVILCLTVRTFSHKIPANFFKGRAQWCKMSWDHKDYENFLPLWNDIPLKLFFGIKTCDLTSL